MSLIKSSLTDYKEKEATSFVGDYEEFTNETGKKCLNDRLCGKLLLIFAIINFMIAITLSSNSLLDMIIEERSKMKPGASGTENWKNPKGEIKVKVHLYGIENPYEFQSGVDTKLKLKEYGPIIYSHHVHQDDLVYEDDGTLSYTTIREFKFLEEESEPGIMNKTITVINPTMVNLASKTGNYFVQLLDDVYLNRTVYELLWNGSSKLLDFFRSHFSYILPTDNFGILYNSFKQYKERYNVRIGPENNSQDFWKINTINGKTKLGNYENFNAYNDCPFSVVNATDGTAFPPYLTKDHKFRLATARVPRYFDMEFQEETLKFNIIGYKYIMTNENFMRTYDSRDCLGNYKNIELPSGVIDASILAYDNPLAFSTPHFYGFHGEWETYIDGLSPNKEKHESYMIIEPISGIPLENKASLQGNNVIGDLKHLSKLKAFSNKIIPTFWIEQRFNNMPHATEIYFMVYVIPILQILFIVMFFLLSILCGYLGIKRFVPLHYENIKFWQKITNRKAVDTV